MEKVENNDGDDWLQEDRNKEINNKKKIQSKKQKRQCRGRVSDRGRDPKKRGSSLVNPQI